MSRFPHMLDAGREATALAAGRTREQLGTDRMLVSALIKYIEITIHAAA